MKTVMQSNSTQKGTIKFDFAEIDDPERTELEQNSLSQKFHSFVDLSLESGNAEIPLDTSCAIGSSYNRRNNPLPKSFSQSRGTTPILYAHSTSNSNPNSLTNISGSGYLIDASNQQEFQAQSQMCTLSKTSVQKLLSIKIKTKEAINNRIIEKNLYMTQDEDGDTCVN